MKILLTGATGFLGGSVVRKLNARGHSLKALVRDPARAKVQFSDITNIEFVAGDLAKPQTAAAALECCDAAIHMAALVKRKAPRALFDLVNVTATELLLREAWKRNIRAIYTSSFFALGPSDGIPAGRAPDSPLCEAETHTDYERTKRAADRALESLRKEGAPFITIYPGVLYGPGEFTEANLVTGIIRDHLRGKVPGLPGGGRAIWSYGYVDDVAEAHCIALERGRPGARLAIPGDNKSGMDFFVEFQKITGIAPPRFAIPIPVVWCVGALEELSVMFTKREPKLTRAEALTYAHDWALDGSSGVRELQLSPTPLSEGLRKTVDWMRERDPALFAKCKF
ncbi:MAG: NAD-dependent epimerase/dehydratase family protein [Planctomycetes bacterium]|nr:NAD-dependent epimerase/dehydratase family protein [Planctomycetota bacterium]